MALRDINLIAPDILEKQYLRRHLIMWSAGLTAVIFINLAVYAYVTHITYTANNGLTGGSERHATLVAVLGEVGRDQQELNLALRQRDQFSATIAMQRSYASIIAKLAETMNEQTWLQQLTIDKSRDHVVHLIIVGSSLSQEHLGNFIQQLSADPLFRGLVLKYSQESEGKSPAGNPVQFQIECDAARG